MITKESAIYLICLITGTVLKISTDQIENDNSYLYYIAPFKLFDKDNTSQQPKQTYY